MHALPFIALYLLLAPLRADAYLDPGSGSLIFQVVIAFFVGIGFAMKQHWIRITNLFRRKKTPSEMTDGTEDEKPSTDA